MNTIRKKLVSAGVVILLITCQPIVLPAQEATPLPVFVGAEVQPSFVYTGDQYIAVFPHKEYIIGIDTLHQIVFQVACQAGEIHYIDEGVYKVRATDRGRNNWALMNNRGEWLTEFRFSDLLDTASEGYLTYWEHKSYFDPQHEVDIKYVEQGLVSLKGEIPGNDRFCFLTRKENYWQTIRMPEQENAKLEFINGLMPVAWLAEENPAEVLYELRRKGSLYGFTPGVKFGYMNTAGELICLPYDKIYPFVEDKAIVANKGTQVGPDHIYEYGYINDKGEEIIPPQFREAEPFDGALAIVSPYGSKFRALINWQGEIVTDSFSHIRKCNKEIWISELSLNGYHSYIDAKTGKRLSRFYAQMECPRTDGMPTPVLLINDHPATYIIGKDKLEKKWGYVDKNGKEILPVVYDEVSHFGQDGMAKVKKDGEYHTINARGEFVP